MAKQSVIVHYNLRSVGFRVRFALSPRNVPQSALPVFGYKSHDISTDRKYGFIRHGTVTSASDADGR